MSSHIDAKKKIDWIYFIKHHILVKYVLPVLFDLRTIGRMIFFSIQKNFKAIFIDKARFPEIHEILKNGIVVLNEKADINECLRVKAKINSLVEKSVGPVTRLSSGTVVEQRVSTYKSGEDYDQGVVHIHNVELEIPEVKNFPIQKYIDMLGKIFGEPFFVFSYACYVSNSVTNTRTYHADGVFTNIYKIFIYLSDVETTDQGPYSYLIKTHLMPFKKIWHLTKNLVLRKHLREFHGTHGHIGKIKHGLGPTGTMILSDQHGFHRGHPQELGNKRLVLVYYIGQISSKSSLKVEI